MKYYSDADFKLVLRDPPAGIFDLRSWNYWNLRYHHEPVPPLPQRKFPQTDVASSKSWSLAQYPLKLARQYLGRLHQKNRARVCALRQNWQLPVVCLWDEMGLVRYYRPLANFGVGFLGSILVSNGAILLVFADAVEF